MKTLIKNMHNFIDKYISNFTAIIIYGVTIVTLINNYNLLTINFYLLGYIILSRKFEYLENKIELLEFEKQNMLLALSEEDPKLKEYLEKK